MAVRVEKCDGCPLLNAEIDLNGLRCSCNHPDKYRYLDITSDYANDTMHKDCPLRNECISIRIK